jgi:phasin family protein
MENDKKPSSDISAIMSQSVEQARGAMENYLRFFEKGMAATPWAGTALSQKAMKYVEQNVATAFAHAQKITQAKDLQEVARLQTDFFQAQLKSLVEQAKDLGEVATKAASDTLRGNKPL